MDIDDLWIGDEVIQLSTGIKGKYQGKGYTSTHKIITADGQLLEVAAEDLIPASEYGKAPVHAIKKDLEIIARKKTKVTYILDLEEADQDPIIRCHEYLQSMIEAKVPRCTILYGQDQTSLKSAVAAVLRGYPEVTIYAPKAEQDGWEVWFEYGMEEE